MGHIYSSKAPNIFVDIALDIYISIRMCECVPVSTELRYTGRLVAGAGILPGAGIWTILSPDSARAAAAAG